MKSFSRLTESNNECREESKRKKGNKTHVLMKKLLTPIARTFPVSRSFSISAQASLKLTLSAVLKDPSGFLGRAFPVLDGRVSQIINMPCRFSISRAERICERKGRDTFVRKGLWPVDQVLFSEFSV